MTTEIIASEPVQADFIVDNAKTVCISTPKSSYGIFCFNSTGDLFLNSDWGFYGYAWRHYGNDFTGFIKRLNSEYVVDKFQINYMETTCKKMPAYRRKHVEVLVNEFIKYVQENL